MSTRELAYSMIDSLTEEQLNALVVILSGMQREEPNEETLAAIAEVEEMMKHPEDYKSYSSAEELTEDILNEVSD